jgi:hypothetical protein
MQCIRNLELKARKDGRAGFSVGPGGRIWRFVTYGKTSEEDKEDVRRKCEVVDEIADRYLALRPEGGRFFMDGMGASYKYHPERSATIPFVNFRRC